MRRKGLWRSKGRRGGLIAALLAAGAALLSCPNPIDRALLTIVEDEIEPVITILQPQANSFYKTNIIVSGVLEDSSKKVGDHLGSPGSLEVSIPNSPALNRTVTFAADGTYSVSPADSTFTYDPDDGSFGLRISAAALSGSQIISFVLTDRNGNETTLTISLFDDPTGPSIDLTSPESYSTYGLIVNIAGTVTNAKADPATTNVKSIAWRVPVAVLERTLDLRPGSTHDIGGGKFANGTFLFDTSDGSFSDQFSTFGQSGTLTLVMWAEDFGGDDSEVAIQLIDSNKGPTIAVTDYPQRYSSTVDPSLTVVGNVSNPANLSAFAYLVMDAAANDVSGNIAMTDPYSFSFSTAGLSGTLTVTIQAQDSGGRDSETSVSIFDDPTGPVITAGTLAADNSHLDITFDDVLYSTGGGSGALAPADLNVGFQANGSGTSLADYTLTKTDGSALLGGEQSVRVNLSYNGTPSGVETVEVRPAAASVFDDVGNAALTATTTGIKLLNDLLAASVQYVSSPTANGPYKAGVEIGVTVRFSEAVYVNGTPTLTLETGAVDQQAVYQTGYATNTLSFLYTVQAGDGSGDLNYAAIDSLAGTIRDNAGNLANRTLPALGSLDSLAGRKDLVIDTTAPAAPTVSIADGDGLINIGENAAGVSATISGEAGAAYLITPLNATVSGGNSGVLTGGADTRTFSAGGEGPVSLSVTLTDAAGNTGTAGSDSSNADLTPPNPPSVTIADGTDGYISPAENAAGVGLTITGTAGCFYTIIPANATVSGGNTGTLATGSETRSFVAAANGPVTLTVSLTDPAGNTGASSADSSFAYIVLPAVPVVTILDGDGRINIAENASGVDFTIDGLAGCSYTITPSNAAVSGELAGSLATGSVTREFSALASGAVSLSVVLQNPVGSTSAPGSDSSNADLSSPDTPSVSIQDGDGWINKAENDAGIDVTISGEADTSYIISLTRATLSDGGTTGILTGGSVTRNINASGSGAVTVSVTLRDAAGNTGSAGSDSSTADLSVPSAPSVTIKDGNGTISLAENTAGVDLEIDGEAGTKYNLTFTNCTVDERTSGTLPGDGNVTLTLRAEADGLVKVEATLADNAENQSPAGSDTSTADLSG